MTGDVNDAAIVRSTIELAHHLARPMPADEVAGLHRHSGFFVAGGHL